MEWENIWHPESHILHYARSLRLCECWHGFCLGICFICIVAGLIGHFQRIPEVTALFFVYGIVGFIGLYASAELILVVLSAEASLKSTSDALQRIADNLEREQP